MKQRCVIFGCNSAKLIWLKRGQSLQTQNGFLIASISGWYCPVCAGSYGGTKAKRPARGWHIVKK